jgi:hypothetical protein
MSCFPRMRLPAIPTLFLAVTMAIAPLASVRADDEKAVLDILKPVSEAALRGDLSAGFDVMYEPAIKDLGGKEKLLESVAAIEKQMEQNGMRLVKSEVLRPVRFVKGAERRYVIVSTLTEMDSPHGLIRSHGFQLGVEVAPGKWQFIDGTKAPLALEKYFTDFPKDEKLPERKQEVVEKDD